MSVYVNLNISGNGGFGTHLGTPTDPYGYSAILNLDTFDDGAEFKLLGAFDLTTYIIADTKKFTFNTWLSNVPWVLSNSTGGGRYIRCSGLTLIGGIFENLAELSKLDYVSGCVLNGVSNYNTNYIGTPGVITQSLIYFRSPNVNASLPVTITNSIILRHTNNTGSYVSGVLFSPNSSLCSMSGIVTNISAQSGIFATPVSETAITYNAPISTGNIPSSGTTTDLQNYCLGYYASGIGPTNFASGYYVRFISESGGAIPYDVLFSGITNVPSSGTVTWTYTTDSTTLTNKVSSHTFTSTGTFPVNLSSYWYIPAYSGGYSGFNTFIYETFSGGAWDSYWNADATGAFPIANTASGYAASFTPGDIAENMRMLTPWGGPYVSGDFSLEAKLMTSGALSTVWPSIGIITVSGTMGLEGLHWARQDYTLTHEVAETHAAGSGHSAGYCRVDLESYQANLGYSPQLTYSGNGRTVGIKLVRTNGIISGYYQDGNNAWASLSGQVNYSGLAALELNGSAWSRFLYIKAEADAGLPYTVLGINIIKTISPPSWVYMSGYIQDNSANSGVNPLWDSAFKTPSSINDMSGFYHTTTPGDYRLIPSGTSTISGAFDFQFDFVNDDNYGADYEIEAYSGLTQLYEIHMFEGKLQINNSISSEVPITDSIGRRYTVRVTRGARLDAVGIPTLENTASGIHSYYYDNFSGGCTYTWREFNTSPTTGTNTNIHLETRIANTPCSGGFDNMQFQTNSLTGTYSDPTLVISNVGTTGFITSAASGWAFDSGNLYTFLPGTVVIGEVYGMGDVFSDSYRWDNDSGLAYGVGYVGGIMRFIYIPSPVPPTSDPTADTKIKPMLTNKSRYPYKVPSDLIVSKVDFLKNGKLSYLSGIPIELWMNYSGTWGKVEDGFTDQYGSCYITHPTSGVTNITNCLGVVKVIYEGLEYVSNIMRYNFYSGEALVEDIVYIIDAAATGIGPDRLGHDIFDGSGRLNFFDRMYIV